jgi:hypothetical protein
MRIPFVLAFAEGMARAIVRNVGALEYVQAGVVEGRNFDSLVITISGREFVFLVRPLASGVALPITSAAESGKWDAFFLLPADTINYRVGPLLYRAMRRFILSDRNQNDDGHYYIQGPWSIKKIAQAYPSFAAQHFTVRDEDGTPTATLKVPVMFSGDPEPTAVAQVDYSPTDADCINDIEPNENDLSISQ